MSDEYETVKVNKRIMTRLKFHLLTNVLPDLIDLGSHGDQHEFREALLSQWVSDSIEEKLNREMPPSKPAKGDIPEGEGIAVLTPDETHL
jgi:hypothetical protein